MEGEFVPMLGLGRDGYYNLDGDTWADTSTVFFYFGMMTAWFLESFS
jgi:hypothetical protein